MMTPEEIASRNQALLVIGACAIGALAYAGFWLLTSEHRVAVWIRSIMSSGVARDTAGDASAGQVWHQVPEPVSVSAEPNTDDTERVPGATGASAIDTSARDIIRASVVAELLDSGLLTNRDKAIMQVFHCSKAASTRPDSPFQVALRLVEQHRAKQRPEYVGEMIARVEREVASERGR
jgi:hypothetical protein